MKRKVFAKLKTKAASLGFNKTELMGVAATIADNLDSDDASDEDIDARIDAALPYLKVAQQNANRVIEASRATSTETDEEDEDESSAGSKKSKTTSKEAPEWARAIIASNEKLMQEVGALKGEKVTNSRKSKLESLLKDSGSFGSRIVKNFTRMKFETEEEFEDFFADVEEDLEEYHKEKGEEAVGSVKPAGGKPRGSDKNEKPSEAELNAVVASM